MISEHVVNSLNNFICGYYHADTTFCDDIIDYYNSENCKDKAPGQVYTTSNGLITDSTKKISYEAKLDNDQQLYFKYFTNLKECVDQYLKKYEFAEKQGLIKSLQYTKIQYYPKNGGFFFWHSERAGMPLYVSRHLVFMTYLNDVVDNGQTEFFYQRLKIKPEKGLTLIWPADWTFTHRGIPSETQEKYIVTGWLNLL